MTLRPDEETAAIRHLSQDDLAERWRISARTLERWRSLDKGPPRLHLGGRVVYRLEDVLAYERAHLRGHASEAPLANAAYGDGDDHE